MTRSTVRVVDGARFGERLEQRLEVGTLLQPVEGPHDVVGRKRASGLELHAFAQVEARGALVDLLVALGEARLDREVLAEPDQRIEQEMRELERGARQLLMRVERGRVGIIGHAQRLGFGGLRGATASRATKAMMKRQAHGPAYVARKSGPVHSPLPQREGLYTVRLA